MAANYVDPYFIKWFQGKNPQQVAAEITSQMPEAMTYVDSASAADYAPYTSKESIERIINTIASTPGATQKLWSFHTFGVTNADEPYLLPIGFYEELGKPMAHYGNMAMIANEIDKKGEKQFITTNMPLLVQTYVNYDNAGGGNLQDFIDALPKAGFTQADVPNLQAGFTQGQAEARYIASISTPFEINHGIGSMAQGLLRNPLAPVFIAAALPGAGELIGASLGTSAATGTALASAGVQAAQGRPLEDIAKGAAIGTAAGTVGSNVAQSTGSTVAGQVAGQATGGLLSGADAGQVASNIGTSLLAGGITGAATEASGSALTGGLVGSTASGLLQGKDLESSLLSGAVNTGLKAITTPTTTPTVPNATKTSSDVAALYGNQGYTGTTLSGGLMTDEERDKLLDEYYNYTQFTDPSAFDAAAGEAANVARNYDFGSAFTEDENQTAAEVARLLRQNDTFVADENQTAAEVARLLRQNSAAPMSNFGPEDTALQASSLNTAKILSTLGSAGKSILDFAKANPTIAGSLLGAITSAVGSKSAPTSTTTTTMMDPQLKAAYLQNLDTAKLTAANLQARQIAEPGAMYTGAEQQLYNLGMTPFGAADIAKFYNPYQEQVVQGALGDIERTRQMQEQANMEQATRAKAFGGSRQGVVSGMTNEAALRQAATTGGQLRQQGFTQAANLGLAARPLDIAGMQTSLGLGATRTALEQARLDALRNLGTERLQLTSGALGMNLPNLGQSSTSPLYSSTAGNLLSGGLTGAYIGSLLDPNRNKQPVTG
jgi:hypothetical protein